jgi:chemotaxis protein CheD
MGLSKDQSYLAKCERYYLKPGYVYVTQYPTVIATVLGSCVAVCLYDKRIRYGGMNHYLLPYKDKNDQPTTRYGDISLAVLYKLFLDYGSQPEDLVAQLVGGAFLAASKDSEQIALANVEVSRRFLKSKNIRIISEDIGGNLGRKLTFFTELNEMLVAKTERIRESDYYSRA